MSKLPVPPNPLRRLSREEFPHLPDAGSHKPPLTLENLAKVLEVGGFDVRFNVIKKKAQILQGERHASLSEVISYANLNGLQGAWLTSFLDELAFRKPYNPVAIWIRSNPWDGIDRLAELIETITFQDGYPADLGKALITRWFLSAVAAVINPTRFKGRGVLTLQGPQGLGKTSWINRLVPLPELQSEFIKLDHHLDPGNKDSIIGAVAHWIVEIGELDSSFKKDIARLKGFLTADCDKLRKPYGKEEVEYNRSTVFAASVNEAQFLVDPTGNSRWWTIGAERLNYQHDIDMQQLYAQIASMLANGQQWWLTEEEDRQLAAYNLRHRSTSAIAERVRDHIDLTRVGKGFGELKTPIQLLNDMGISNLTNSQCKECGSVLRELIGPPSRVNGRDQWRIPRRDAPRYPSGPQFTDDEF